MKETRLVLGLLRFGKSVVLCAGPNGIRVKRQGGRERRDAQKAMKLADDALCYFVLDSSKRGSSDGKRRNRRSAASKKAWFGAGAGRGVPEPAYPLDR
jgi:hypothetical protein